VIKATAGRARDENKVKASKFIIFDAESIRAMLAGTKSQTRRVVKWPDWCDSPLIHSVTPAPFYGYGERGEFVPLTKMGGMCARPFCTQRFSLPCPYGKPGDLLWVRERMHWGDEAWVYSADGQVVYYDKSIEHVAMSWSFHKENKACSPIHMPRWASRLTIELTSVRVERVQDICDSDAVDEGIEYRNGYFQGGPHRVKGTPKCFPDAPSAFADRWDAINAKRGYPWDANPWVWVLAFKVHRQNIDAVLKARAAG